ncbi:MAG: hypothetical protein SX243_23870 [Acidobacteriota bacterium]|nr:hypothetical protein [Acidobacteriota bacterium]
MRESSNKKPTIELDSYRWAVRSLTALAGVAWPGFLIAVVYVQWNLQFLENVLLLLGGIGIPICLFCLFLLYRSLEFEQAFEEDDRKRLRAAVLLTGPGGALQVVLHARKLHRAGLV